MKNCSCVSCGKVAPDWQKEFWKVNMGLGEEDPYSSYCKDCFCKTIKYGDINTFKFLCKELNIPFIKQEIELALRSRFTVRDRVVAGRYIAKMRLKNYYPFHYEDSDNFNKENK